ncbi:MAG: hypothetical protein CFE24_01370 [Flavobacterium sp. BFFFF2]|nr:MAG: hypothetical protein CFE24_01370 [Flavobacterium sp. BFFFF2]
MISFAQDLEILHSSNNPFNSIGRANFDFLIELVNLSQQEKTTFEDLGEKIKNSPYNQNINLNIEELNTFERYFTDNPINCQSIIDFENYIINSKLNYSKDNLLKSVAILKWNVFFMKNASSFVANTSTNRPKGVSFEGCFNYCMVRRLTSIENGNWIDKAEFILGQPYNTAWMAASCSWNCR